MLFYILGWWQHFEMIYDIKMFELYHYEVDGKYVLFLRKNC